MRVIAALVAVWLAGSSPVWLGGCSGRLPGMDPYADAPASPSAPWIPRADQVRDSGPPDPNGARRMAMPTAPALAPGAMSLMELVDIALHQNPTTRQKWAAARGAAATYGEAQGAYYPSIELGFQVTNERQPSLGGSVAYQETVLGPSASLDFLLLDFGGRSARVEAARQALLAANWTQNQNLQDVVLGVVTAYHVHVGAEAALRAAETSLEESATSLTSAERRRQAGVGTVTDVFLARAEQARIRLEAIRRRGEVAVAVGALATAMGLPANAPLQVAPPATPPQLQWARVSVESLIERTQMARPDLAASWARLREAESAVRTAKSNQWPTLSLRADTEWRRIDGKIFRSSFDNDLFPYRATLDIEYPLFQGFSLRNAVRRSESVAEEARADADNLMENVIEQVWNSYQDLTTASAQVEASLELLESAELSYDAALSSYRSGLNTIVELMQAQTTLADGRFENVDAQTAWYVALAQLARDTGMIPLSGEPLAPGAPRTQP